MLERDLGWPPDLSKLKVFLCLESNYIWYWDQLPHSKCSSRVESYYASSQKKGGTWTLYSRSNQPTCEVVECLLGLERDFELVASQFVWFCSAEALRRSFEGVRVATSVSEYSCCVRLGTEGFRSCLL